MTEIIDAPLTRPLEPLSLAKESSRAKLSEKLQHFYHFEPNISDAISRIVVDPAKARDQIERPIIKRIPNGRVKILELEVFTPGVCLGLFNPRSAEYLTYPAGVDTNDKAVLPLMVSSTDSGTPVIRIDAKSPSQVQQIIHTTRRVLNDNELLESIRTDGVMEPVTIVMTRICHGDGTPDALVPMAIDGSTRTSYCHMLAGFSSVDVLYKLPTLSTREWRGLLGRVLEKQHRAVDTLTTDDAAAYRAMTFTAKVVVAFEPLRISEPIDIVTASRAIVGLIHVGHPREWSPSGTQDELAEAVLDRLVADSKISIEKRQYLSGLMERAEFTNQGFSPYMDVRAAHVLKTMYARGNEHSISLGIKGLTAKIRVGPDDKPKLATELILRGFRHKLQSIRGALVAVRLATERTIGQNHFRELKWDVTGRSPDELLVDAVEELKSNRGSFGPAQLELAIYGSYYLLSSRVLQSDVRVSNDRRDAGSVLSEMMRSEHGLRQLHRSVVEGRRFDDISHCVTKVDQEGRSIEHATGGLHRLNNIELRAMFPPTEGIDIGPSSLSKSPHEERDFLVEEVRRKADEISDLVRGLETIKDGNQFLVIQEGVPAGTARKIADSLQQISFKFINWAAKYEALAPGDQFTVLSDSEVFDGAIS